MSAAQYTGKLPPNGYAYRPLKREDRGWDVYALQSALDLHVYPLLLDGHLGGKTHAAVVDFQDQSGLKADGIAGVATQRVVALRSIWPVQKEHALPPGLLRGQVEKESAFLLGNHTPAYGEGPWWDAGVCQRSTRYTPMAEAFHVIKSCEELAQRNSDKYVLYKGFGKVKDERRLRELAAGAWNAPAWTDRLAQGLSLSETQRTWIEAYIERVTVYYR